MRRRRGRFIFFAACAGLAAAALFAPEWPGLRTAAGAAFVPVSHPANAAGRAAAGAFERRPVDAASPGRPRAVRAVYDENERLRQQVVTLLRAVEQLKRLNRDRSKLGTPLRDLCRAARVVAAPRDDADEVLQLAPGTPASAGMRVLHTTGSRAGVVGTVLDANPAGARVRLVTDPRHRPVDARFVRFVDGRPEEVATEAFVVSGIGGGRCAVARHRQADLEENGVEPGMWAVLTDPAWPEPSHGLRVARVASVEPINDAPGFARVVMEPSATLFALGEVMVVVRE